MNDNADIENVTEIVLTKEQWNDITRKCPKCGSLVVHKGKNAKSHCKNAIHQRRTCNSCSHLGIPRTDILGENNPSKRTNVRQKLSERFSGERNPMFGKYYKDNPNYGKRRTPMVIKTKSHKLGLLPTFNPLACQKIDEYGKQHGYKFQHALNGGELHIKELGYWVDGYDMEKNVVIEYYESRHRKFDIHARDEERKRKIIEHLNCEFIELKDWL